MTHESSRCLNAVDGPHPSDGFDRAQRGLPEATRSQVITTFEYRPSGTSRMTRRKLFGGVALSGFALSSVSTASTSLTPAPAADLARLALNENPLGPSPLAVRAIQSALTEIARYAGDDAHALERQIAEREGVSPDQIILGEILDALGLQLALSGDTGGEFIYSEPGYTALVDAVAPGGGVVVGVPLNAHLENDLPAIAARVTDRTRAIYIVILTILPVRLGRVII